jgi:16S rRNA (cytosine967-C5)-methyltransferase
MPWLKQESDLAALTALQQRLLDHAVGLVKPGGVLVYCTCSLEPDEGIAAVERLLAREPGLKRSPVMAHELDGRSELLTSAGDLRTLPCHMPDPNPRLSGMDGFYAARLMRV